MRAAGGRVAQLIKMPVLMSQPVTPGSERERGGGVRERGWETGRQRGRERMRERELPGVQV